MKTRYFLLFGYLQLLTQTAKINSEIGIRLQTKLCLKRFVDKRRFFYVTPLHEYVL